MRVRGRSRFDVFISWIEGISSGITWIIKMRIGHAIEVFIVINGVLSGLLVQGSWPLSFFLLLLGK